MSVPLLKCRRSYKKSLHYGIASLPEKFHPADNLPVKVRLARAAAGREDFCR